MKKFWITNSMVTLRIYICRRLVLGRPWRFNCYHLWQILTWALLLLFFLCSGNRWALPNLAGGFIFGEDQKNPHAFSVFYLKWENCPPFWQQSWDYKHVRVEIGSHAALSDKVSFFRGSHKALLWGVGEAGRRECHVSGLFSEIWAQIYVWN